MPVLPPNHTELAACAPPKAVPVMVTSAPGSPEAGSSFVNGGFGAVTVKPAALVPVPPRVVTATMPWWHRPAAASIMPNA